MSSGKVDLGCFRTYPESYIAEQESKGEHSSKQTMVPLEKLEDFGIHSNKYYQLEHSFFKSKLDY